MIFFGRLLKAAYLDYPRCPENFLTECFAAVLEEDPGLANQFVRRLLACTPDCGSPGLHVEGITTQENCDGHFPDLFLRLDDNSTIAVEIKLQAAESPNQLKTYLEKKKVTYVAYITPRLRAVEDEVLKNPNYLRPPDGPSNFKWCDFYDLIVGDPKDEVVSSPLRTALVGLFDNLGLDPPVPKLDNRPFVDGLLESTRQWLKNSGFQLPGSQGGEIWTSVQTEEPFSLLWVDAINSPGWLKVRVHVGNENDSKRIHDALDRNDNILTTWNRTYQRKATLQSDESAKYAVEAKVDVRHLASPEPDEQRIEEAFVEIVKDIVCAAWDVVGSPGRS